MTQPVTTASRASSVSRGQARSRRRHARHRARHSPVRLRRRARLTRRSLARAFLRQIAASAVGARAGNFPHCGVEYEEEDGGLGTDARPSLGPPSAAVAEELAMVAKTPFALADWRARARVIGGRLGASVAAQILGAMVNPPSLQIGFSHAAWIFRFQVFSALALGFVDEGWEQSERRRALLAAALGPIDWTTSAAIVGLAEVMRDEPNSRREINDAFERLLGLNSGPLWTNCVLHPLASCWPRGGDMPRAAGAMLAARIMDNA